jgi:hypothetical protein
MQYNATPLKKRRKRKKERKENSVTHSSDSMNRWIKSALKTRR